MTQGVCVKGRTLGAVGESELKHPLYCNVLIQDVTGPCCSQCMTTEIVSKNTSSVPTQQGSWRKGHMKRIVVKETSVETNEGEEMRYGPKESQPTFAMDT